MDNSVDFAPAVDSFDDLSYQSVVIERLETISDACTQVAVVSTFAVTLALGAVIIYIIFRPIFDFWRR